MARVLVLGAGVIGVTTAYFLARRGYEVTVVDRAGGAAEGASYANGAQLSYSYTDPLADPSILSKLPKLIAGLDPAFSIKPSVDPRLFAWGARFLRNCTTERARSTAYLVYQLAEHSRSQLHGLIEHTGIEFLHERRGKMIVATRPEEMSALALKVEEKKSWIGEIELLDADECRAVEPALEHWDDPLEGGLFSPNDETGDARQFVERLADYCKEQLGVTFLFDCEVTDIRKRGDNIHCVETSCGELSADVFVLSLGVGSVAMGQKMNVQVPIYPLKGYSLTVPAGSHTPKVSLTHPGRKIVYCTLGDKLRVAGLAEIQGYGDAVDEKKAENLRKIAKMVLPLAGNYDQPELKWAGLRPATPTGVPIIGPSTVRNLYMNTGHGMLGWTLACGSASTLVDMIDSALPQTFGSYAKG